MAVEPLALARQLRAGRFPATLYLEGPCEALKAQFLATLRRAWMTRDPHAPPARVLRANETSVEEILALFQGASLFNPRDLILVLEVEDLGRSEKRIAALSRGLGLPAGESCLTLIESSADQPRKSLEPLRAACEVRVVALAPDRDALLAWGALELEALGLSARPGVIESLADASDGDALAFFGELSRLGAWAAPGSTVSEVDVAQILRPAIGAELPDYVAAVAAGDPRLAGRRLGRLLAAGVGEGTILFALSNLVGGALGGWKRFHAASDALRRRRGSNDLLQALDAVYRAEAAWKGGRADVVALLERATRDVCGAA
jgi:DNA polymerase III delta subunit